MKRNMKKTPSESLYLNKSPRPLELEPVNLSWPHSLLWHERVTRAFRHIYLHPMSLSTQDEAESIKTFVCHQTFYRLWKRFRIWKAELPGPWHSCLPVLNQRIWLFQFHIIHWCSFGAGISHGWVVWWRKCKEQWEQYSCIIWA